MTNVLLVVKLQLTVRFKAEGARMELGNLSTELPSKNFFGLVYKN
jgi:hypothetical protein